MKKILLAMILSYPAMLFAYDSDEEGCKKNNALCCYELGGAYYRIKNPDYIKALKYLNKSCNLNEPRACYLLGSIYFRGTGVKKDEEIGRSYYLKVAETTDGKLNINFGRMYATGQVFPKDEMKALEYFKRACNAGRDDACVYHLRLLNKEKIQKNISLDGVSDVVKRDENYYTLLGTVYLRKGQPYKTLEYYKKAIDINPKFPTVYYNQGVVYADEFNDYESAILSFNKAITLDDKKCEFFVELGHVYRYLKRNTDSKKAYERAIELFEKMGNGNISLVLFGKKVLEFKGKCTHSRIEEAYLFLGLIYGKTKAYDKEVELIKKAIEINPNKAVSYLSLGVSYSCAKNYKEAIKAYKKAIELDPKMIKAYNNLGNSYGYMGNLPKALETFQKELTVDLHRADTYFAIANVYYDLKSYNKARNAYREAVRLKPNHKRAKYELDKLERLFKMVEEKNVQK